MSVLVRSSTVLAAVLFLFGHAVGQCTKDSECKGSRICVNGQCTEPATQAPAPEAPGTAGAIGGPCNPPCADGYECDAASHTCVPVAIVERPQSPMACPPGEVYYGGRCASKANLVKTGNVSFVIFNIFYAMGTTANVVDNVVVLSIDGDEPTFGLPGTVTGYSLFGGLSRISMARQRAVLRTMSAPNRGQGLALLGRILYLTSVGMGGLNIGLGIGTEGNSVPSNIVSVMQIPLVCTSFIVNTAVYMKQRGSIENAANRASADRPSGDQRLAVVPYVGATKNRTVAGVAVLF